MIERKTAEEWWYILDDEFGDSDLNVLIVETLAELPNDIGDRVVKDLLIIRCEQGMETRYYSKNSVQDRALIILSPDFPMGKEGKQILKFRIAGHILGHSDYMIPEAQYEEEERKQWSLVREWEITL